MVVGKLWEGAKAPQEVAALLSHAGSEIPASPLSVLQTTVGPAGNENAVICNPTYVNNKCCARNGAWARKPPLDALGRDQIVTKPRRR